MAVAHGPAPSRADIGMRATGIGSPHTVKPLEALCQLERCLRYGNHERIRSTTCPTNQKFSAPAQSAWSASPHARKTAVPQSAPPPRAAAKATVLAAQYSAMNQSASTHRTPDRCPCAATTSRSVSMAPVFHAALARRADLGHALRAAQLLERKQAVLHGQLVAAFALAVKPQLRISGARRKAPPRRLPSRVSIIGHFRQPRA